jgi:hypothetical protein
MGSVCQKHSAGVSGMTSYAVCDQCNIRKQVVRFRKDPSRERNRSPTCLNCEGGSRDKWPELRGMPIELLNKI